MTLGAYANRCLGWGAPLLAVVLGGCISHWVAVPLAPATAVSVGSANEYRITCKDGTLVRIYNPMVAADSIIAFAAPKPAWPDEPVRVAIALGGVAAVSARKIDGAASAGLAFGIMSVLLLGYYVEVIEPLGSMR